MKRTVFVSLWLAMLPWVASAQSVRRFMYRKRRQQNQSVYDDLSQSFIHKICKLPPKAYKYHL